MKAVILMFAFFIMLTATLERFPIIASNKKLTHVYKVKKLPKIPKLPKHNLNKGQLKQMYFLKYIDKT